MPFLHHSHFIPFLLITVNLFLIFFFPASWLEVLPVNKLLHVSFHFSPSIADWNTYRMTNSLSLLWFVSEASLIRSSHSVVYGSYKTPLIRTSQICAEKGHSKKRCLLVSIWSLQNTQDGSIFPFQLSMRSPVDNLSFIAIQSMKEYFGVAYLNQTILSQWQSWCLSLKVCQVSIEERVFFLIFLLHSSREISLLPLLCFSYTFLYPFIFCWGWGFYDVFSRDFHTRSLLHWLEYPKQYILYPPEYLSDGPTNSMIHARKKSFSHPSLPL